MEVYDECGLCEQWNDLVKWRDYVFVCNDCMNYLLERAPVVQGKYKCNNEDTFMMVKADRELENMKGSQSNG